jgi:hypothetical protein
LKGKNRGIKMDEQKEQPKDNLRGYGKGRGKPSSKDVKNLKAAKALLESSTLMEAYKKLHPKSSDKSANMNGYRMINEQVIEEVRRVLALEKAATATRENLEKLLFMVVSQWVRGTERTENMLNAIKLLTQLVPDFKERFSTESLPQNEDEINKELKRFGFDPTKGLN